MSLLILFLKAAKIMVCVQDDLLRKDSTKKRVSNILYWGLVPVFDHRYEFEDITSMRFVIVTEVYYRLVHTL